MVLFYALFKNTVQILCSHLRCRSCLCTLSSNNIIIPCMWTLLASSFIHTSLHLFDFWKKICLVLLYQCLCNLFCHVVPPTHLRLKCHPSTCTDKWYPKASTLCPMSLSRKKAQVVSHSYLQKKAYHPRRIFWLLVAISNATCFARLAEEGKK